MRLGEVLGLEVEDIHFDRAELSVRQQPKSHKGRLPYLGRPKTKTSVRVVELPEVEDARNRSRWTLNESVREWPDALDRTRALVDGALGMPEAAATSAGSRA